MFEPELVQSSKRNQDGLDVNIALLIHTHLDPVWNLDMSGKLVMVVLP